MNSITYTQHAESKFELLERHGFEVTHDQVAQTVLQPEQVISQAKGRFIAQRQLTARHVLRVIYREEGEKRIVITFYAGRRERYATPIRS